MLHFKSQQLHCESVTSPPPHKGQFDKMVSNSPEYKTYPFQWMHWEVQPVLNNNTASCHFVFSSHMGPLQFMVSCAYLIIKKEGGNLSRAFFSRRNLEIPTSFPYFMLQNTSAWYILLLSAQKITSEVSGCSKQKGLHHCFDLVAGKVSTVFECDYLMIY